MMLKIAVVVLVVESSGRLGNEFSDVSAVNQASQVAANQDAVEKDSVSAKITEDSQCNRQCRWEFKLYDNLDIVGERKAKAGSLFDWGGKYCKCYDSANGMKVLGDGKLIPRESTKIFLPETWAGNFSTDLVCVAGTDLWSTTGLETMTRNEAATAGRTILHCGECSACSAMPDVVVLSLSRRWITAVMTQVSTDFAAPVVGHHDVARLQKNLFELGMNFSMSRPDGRKDRSTCMDVWTDNIQNDGFSCQGTCFIKFFDPSNPNVDITKCSSYPLEEKLKCNCLKCDEENSGPAFIKGAGANRRSTGIKSDIERPSPQICPVGIYSKVTPENLPTAPEPSKEEIARVLKKNR